MTKLATPDYQMVISRTTIDKLGIKLYDKVSAVVAELVANAYDADAESVEISAPLGTYLAEKTREKNGISSIVDRGYEIRVSDDGHGMTPDEVQNYYLQVGMDRRKRKGLGDKSRKKKRPVLGRKGIGKLAPFGICKVMEVISSGGKKTQEGYPTAHIILHYEDIVSDTEEKYKPQKGDQDGTYSREPGTIVILRDFYYKLIPNPDIFHRQLAARFGISRKDWKVKVFNSLPNQEVTEFVLGQLEIAVLDGTKMEFENEEISLDSGKSVQLNGWIAYSKEAYRDEVMAGVRIYARGKIVAQTRDFDLPAGFTGEHKMRSYLIGELHADWLDESEDLIRSDRQDILWNSELGEALKSWGQKVAKEVAGKSEASISNQVWIEFLERSNIEEEAKKRFKDKEMREQIMRVARIMISKRDRDALKDKDYIEGVKRQAFAFGPHRVLVEALQEITDEFDEPLYTIVALLSRAGIAEKYSLGIVAFERIKVIERIRKAWNEGEKEHVFQNIIEEAPWLINPQWTQLSANKSLENFRVLFAAWYEKKYGEEIVTSSIKDPSKRPDFVMLTFRGRLEIVEIKKPDHALTDDEFDRLFGYIDAVNDYLEENPKIKNEFPHKVHAILVCDSLGLSPRYKDHYDRFKNDGDLEHRTWNEFLNETTTAHQNFLDSFESEIEP